MFSLVMLPPQIAAAHARRHRHAVGERAGIRARLDLAHHDAADRGHEREPVDVVVVERIDAAGVAFAAGVEDLRTISSAMSKPWYLKIASTTPSFSVENGCALPILLLGHDDERLVRPAARSRPCARWRGRTGDGVGGAAAVGVPIGRLEPRLLRVVDEIAALLLQRARGRRRRQTRRRAGCRPPSSRSRDCSSC